MPGTCSYKYEQDWDDHRAHGVHKLSENRLLWLIVIKTMNKKSKTSGSGRGGQPGVGRGPTRRCHLRILRKCGRGLGKEASVGRIISGSGRGVHISLHGNSQRWMWRAAWTQLVWLDKEREEHRGVRPELRWGWRVDIAGQVRTWGFTYWQWETNETLSAGEWYSQTWVFKSPLALVKRMEKGVPGFRVTC